MSRDPQQSHQQRPGDPQDQGFPLLPGLELSLPTLAALDEALPVLSDRVVTVIIDEVPSYADALSGPMGETIREAVRLALRGFTTVAAKGRVQGTVATPNAPVLDGAYQLGRGEARSGRSADALLSAYRIGARVSWQELSTRAVEQGAGAETIARFATLVFAFIDELSAASVAGHTDELATSGRVRERLLERLGRRLLEGIDEDDATAAAEDAGWTPPATLTAVVLPESQVRTVVGALRGEPLQVRVEDLEERLLLLVPDAHGRARGRLLHAVEGRAAVVGPARAWLQVGSSYDRARRVHDLGLGPDTETHLAHLVLTADGEALEDLRRRVLAPLDDLKAAAREKLVDTLREWLLRHGRREEVAEALFVHPQTVRYRMNQLRELYGETLEDPATVLELTIALGIPSSPRSV